MSQRDWNAIILRAEQLVNSYPYLITLRQLHYLLVSVAVLLGYANDDSCYKHLSRLTAAGRRAGTFPALLDQTRSIHRYRSWRDPKDAIQYLSRVYRRDRTEGQEWLIILGGEKATLLAQLQNWFGDLGFPIVLLRGYGSQSYIDTVAEMVNEEGYERDRKVVLIYAGDFDPSGEDILRDFRARCPGITVVEHIAVTPKQPKQLGLIENPGKASDSRAGGFIAKHGKLVQVEVEAIDPNTLRQLYQDAIDRYWDESTYDAVIEQETAERQRLVNTAKRWRP